MCICGCIARIYFSAALPVGLPQFGTISYAGCADKRPAQHPVIQPCGASKVGCADDGSFSLRGRRAVTQCQPCALAKTRQQFDVNCKFDHSGSSIGSGLIGSGDTATKASLVAALLPAELSQQTANVICQYPRWHGTSQSCDWTDMGTLNCQSSIAGQPPDLAGELAIT